MNHFKTHIKEAFPTIGHFLTYADNYAIGYFKKQVSLPLSILRDNSTARCRVSPKRSHYHVLNGLGISRTMKEVL